jgi:serine/threonine-protein kinase
VQSVLADRYELRERIGVGGMATVWRGFDRRLGREVAVKVLSEALAADLKFRRRFEREAHHVASLLHPNIVVIHDFGVDGNALFIVMELVRGQSLRQVLAGGTRLPAASVIALSTDVLAGLGHAHATGLLHRDLKPANILLTEDGVAKVADFGIAKGSEESAELTRGGGIVATVSYASPEQLSGGPLGPPSDLYSLGCVFYECLAGRPPFEADSIASLISQQLLAEPVHLELLAPDAPPELISAVMRSLNKDPGDRFATTSAMAEALGAPADNMDRRSLHTAGVTSFGDGAQAAPAGRSGTTTTIDEEPGPTRRRKPLWAALAFGAILAGGAIALLAVGTQSSSRSPQRPRAAASLGYTPTFVARPCPTGVATDPGVSCGDLVVPEDRAKPTGRQLHLLIVRAAAQTPRPAPDPVVDVAGGINYGGGEGPSSNVRLYSDYIELSARGNIGSDPLLSCPEEQAAQESAIALAPRSPQAEDMLIAGFQACRARLVASGIDPNAYGADAAADDVRDLLRALKIDRANLTTLEAPLTVFNVMRRWPQLVRTATIFDPVPPGADPHGTAVADLNSALERYVALCAASSGCHAQFPDLRGHLLQDYLQYQAKPVLVSVPFSAGKPPVPVLVNGDRFAKALAVALLNLPELPIIASAIYSPNAQLAAVAAVAAVGTAPALAPAVGGQRIWGAQASSQCKDFTPNGDTRQEQAQIVLYPFLAGVASDLDQRMCDVWEVRPDNAGDFTPVVSSIPTLLINGALNPESAPEWLDAISQGLAHGTTLDMPTLTLFDKSGTPSCVLELRLAFLRSPTTPLDVSACEAQSPRIAFAGT